MHKITLFVVTFAILPLLSKGQEKSLISPGAEVKLVKTGFDFTEGPAVKSDGSVYFTDQPNDKIYRWSENGGVELFLDGSRRANGTYFNSRGQLVACADLYNQLIAIGPDKKITVLCRDFQGKHLNGPNDLWIAPAGGIYFTDPYYHRSYWEDDHTEVQDERGVYYMSPQGVVSRVATGFKQPNGLVGTPDGKTLYVADINDRTIWRYDILDEGTLGGKTFFAAEGSDGMTIDNRGNVYLTYDKVWVYSPGGELIDTITFPEKPSNVCFGGRERDLLFVTARKSVYTLKMNVKGVE